MTSLINQNQVVENRAIESRAESQILKVCLTGLTKRKKKAGNRLTSRIPTLRKRYRVSCFSVQLYRSWSTDAKENVGISYFRQAKKIILWLSHVKVSVPWITKTKWTQSTAGCRFLSRVNVSKNTHFVYMMDTANSSLSRKLLLKKTHLPDYQKK